MGKELSRVEQIQQHIHSIQRTIEKELLPYYVVKVLVHEEERLTESLQQLKTKESSCEQL